MVEGHIIVISEIFGLHIPCSMKINYKSQQFYLYPQGYASHLEKHLRLSREEKKVRIPPINYNLFKRKGDDAYIVFENNLDVPTEPNQITNKIYETIRPILSILSFLCSFIFKINRIFVFKKTQNFFKFWRIISHSLNNEKGFDSRNLVIFTPFEIFEEYFNNTLSCQGINDSYYGIIGEFLYSKLKTSTLEIKLMILWNTLEHLTAIYCKERGLKTILNKKKLGHLNDVLKIEKLKLKKEDIEFPGISVKDINKRLLKVHNWIPVLNKVKLMLFDLYNKKLKKTEDLVLLIKKFRDKMYHHGTHVNDLLEYIKKKQGLSKFDFQDLIDKTYEFERFIEELLLRLFKLIPDHLKIINFHNSDNLYEWKEEPFVSKIYRSEDIMNEILNAKDHYTRKKRYGSIIKYIERSLLPLINSSLYENEIEGIIFSVNKQKNVKIKFINEFSGEFYGNFTNINDWKELKDIYFSSQHKNSFILEFRFYSQFEYPLITNEYIDYLNTELRERLSHIEFSGDNQERKEIFNKTMQEILKERKFKFSTLFFDIKKIES